MSSTKRRRPRKEQTFIGQNTQATRAYLREYIMSNAIPDSNDFEWSEVEAAFQREGNPIKNKMARCPCHDDRNPSLSVNVKDGRLLVRCHATCDQIEVYKACLDIVRPGQRRSSSLPPLKKASPPSPTDNSNIERLKAEYEKFSEVGSELPEYCKRKGIKHHGAKQDGSSLVVPMYSEGGLGDLIGYQVIESSGEKRTATGSKKAGSGFIIGNHNPGDTILVCEGFATAASVYECSGFPAVCAFGVDNLLKVADALKGSGYSPIVSPDKDEAGSRFGEQAKERYRVAIPQLNGPHDPKENDWNDLAKRSGAEEVKRQIEEALESKEPEEKYERGSEWPEVEPLQTATDPTPYPLQVLPRRIREAIEQGHASTQAPLPLVACALFSAGSAAIQSIVEAVRPDFSGCDRATIPAVLWFLSVAESGERKTTTDRLFSAPIKERGRTEQPCWQKVIGDREVIRHKRVWVDDVTAEGVRDHLYDVFPAIFCSTTEGGKFLGGHSLRDSQRAQGLGAYNSLWDGEGSSVARAGKRTKYLPNVRGVLSISIQPSIVESVHGHDFTDSGFYPRFLICQPESTIGKRFIGEDSKETRNDAAVQAMRGTIRDLFDLEEQWDDTTGFIKQFRELELDNDAAQLWRGFFNKVEEAQAPGGKLEGLRGFASKAAEQVLRVSAVLHLLEYSTAGLQERVSAETMTAAQAVVLYHLNEAQRLLETVRPGGTDTRAAVALERWLVEQCTGGRKVSTREVSQFGPSPCRHKEARDKAIQILESYGRARVVREGKQKLLEVNPEVLEEYRNG